MRIRILQLLLFLGLCCQLLLAQDATEGITSAYSIAGCRYWFDNSTEVTQTDYVSGKIAIDVSKLEEGFHTLHYQILDSRGQVSPARTTPFFRLQTVDEEFKDYTISTVRYWFDKDYTPKEVAYTRGTSSIDVSALEEGFHTLHYQVIDSKGETSPSRTSSFFRLQAEDEKFKDYSISTVRYWFDKDYTPKEVAYNSGTSAIDVSALEEGFHTLHYQVIDSKGETSPSRTSSFFRLQAEAEKFKDSTISTVRYWFDKDYTPKEVTYTSGASAIDVSALEEGFHTLHYQVIDSKGETSPSRTSSFFRLQAENEKFKDYTISTVRYWFDKDYTPKEVTYTSGTSAIDVSALEEGFHTLHYQVIDSKGESSPTRTSPFFRLESKEEKFKDYTVQSVNYWIDGDITTMRTENFENGAKVLDLSGLREGVHTLCYQVMTDDGQVSPVRSAVIDRWLYDIYVSDYVEYADTTIARNPLFANKPDLKIHYMPEDTGIRGHLTVDEGTTLSLGKYVQTANWGNKNDASKYTKIGIGYYHPTTLLNNGFMRADGVLVKQNLYRDRWHFISLPFNANINDIEAPVDTYWAIRGYDGDARAAGQLDDTWRDLMSGEQMEASKGYIIQLTREGDDTSAEITFKAVNDTKKNDIFTSDDVTVTLQEHLSEFAHNRSWNLIGNPYPSFYDTRCIGQEGTIIVWNGNGYSAYSLNDDSYILMPFEAFFIQKPLDAEQLSFSKEGRQHTNEVLDRAAARARFKASRAHARRIIKFKLTDGTYTDYSRLVINEGASMGYEMDKDAPKFMELRPQKAQLYSIDSGIMYAINERPQSDGLVTFSIYAPADGEYRFSVDGDVANITLLDTETNRTWALEDGDYVFSATEGKHNARLLVSLTGDATSLSQIETSDDGEMKVVNGQLSFHFSKPKHIKVYRLDGRTLYNKVTDRTSIKLSQGVYVSDINGNTSKIIVK